jgi:hypothetical protein
MISWTRFRATPVSRAARKRQANVKRSPPVHAGGLFTAGIGLAVSGEEYLLLGCIAASTSHARIAMPSSFSMIPLRVVRYALVWSEYADRRPALA